MKYIESIYNGFRLINRNWQLVLIQVGMVLMSSIGFFIIVGLPLAIAFIIFGIDLTGLADVHDIFKLFSEPSDILSKYLGMILIIIASIILYVLVVAMLGIYLFGGSIGVIGRSIEDASLKFTLRNFFHEAKRLFLRLLGFTSLIGLIFIVAAFFFGLLGGGIAAIISYAQSQDSTLALFLGTFFSLILVIICLILILGILSVTLYGFAALLFKNTGAFKSIHEAVGFLVRYPNGFWLYTVLFISYLLASFLLILIGYPFTIIPVVGTILSFPYQLLSYAFETYLGLVIIAIILSYYYAKEFPKEPAAPLVENPVSENPEEEKPTEGEPASPDSLSPE